MTLFDLSSRMNDLSKHGDPLERLNKVIDWKLFLPIINMAFYKVRKSAAGRKPYNRVIMFKVLVLQSLYNLSHAQTEYQIKDRLSFMRFLEVSIENPVPDEKIIWAFREVLERLFMKLDEYLASEGLRAKLGVIVDASLIEAPRRRNSKDDNDKIKQGEIPKSFMEQPAKLRQKDVDARWTIKGGQRHYGYKNHIAIDPVFKLIRGFEVTSDNVGDIRCLEPLLKAMKLQEDKAVWADGAYYLQVMEQTLKIHSWRSKIVTRFRLHDPECSERARENSRRSKVRVRVEHVFGFMENSMHHKLIRSIGLIRAKAKITLMNLTYNLCRYEQLQRIGAS